MTLLEIYQLAIKMAVKTDPRGEELVKRHLAKQSQKYKNLSEKNKKYFDKESLINPYSDSRILFGDPNIKVKKLMAGIDAEASEILLVDRLNQKGEKIDLIISHHPSGHALAGLYEVMDIQVDMFAQSGVPENVAHSLFEEKKILVQRKIKPSNLYQVIDTARLLNIPLLALHTAWDNLGNQFMQEYIKNKKFDNVSELLDYINEIPEFDEALKIKMGPSIVLGSKDRRTGKIMIGFTGGTNPSKELYVQMAKAGVGTLVEMHIPEESIDELKKLHINVIDVGHIAADSIGANLFLDELEKKEIQIIPCSGLIRIKRIKT